MDGTAVCDSCGDKACCPVVFKDRLCLVDWKSSNHLNITYLWQAASYRKAKMEEFPDLNIEDVFILRLGKSEEEAGKFEPWHATAEESEEDFQGFLACLTLTRVVDSVEERMGHQKSNIRAIKKEQRETAKALAKEQEKLQKALDKAAAKLAKEEEKKRIKEEAKAERELQKKLKKMGALIGTVNPDDLPRGITPEEPCTSLESTQLQTIEALKSDIITLKETGTAKNSTANTSTKPLPEILPDNLSTTSTVEQVFEVSVENNKELLQGLSEPEFVPFKIPMES
jgi:hypothetical protein